MPEVGVITEQGDLGLGYDPLTEKDTQALQESEKKKESTAE